MNGSDEEWFADFRAGRLSAEEADACAARLAADRGLARRYLRWNAFECEIRRQMKATAQRRESGWSSGRNPVVRPSRRWRPWLGLAAAAAATVAALLVAGIHHGAQPMVADPVPVRPVAHQPVVSDLVRVVEAAAGDHLDTIAGVDLRICFADGSSAILSGAGSLDVTAVVPGKRLLLLRGRLSVSARAQPPGQPLTITTPHARAVVVGTEFVLTVEAGATTLAVDHGAVRFIADGRTRDVEAGDRVSSTPANGAAGRFRRGLDLLDGRFLTAQDEVDLMALATAWEVSEPGTLDGRGWPTQASVERPAVLTIAGSRNGRYPGGRVMCRWQGTGTLVAEGDATEIARGPGWLEIEVAPSDAGIRLRLTATRADDHLRALRIRPVDARADIFRPEAIARLGEVGLIRSGEWGEGFGQIDSLEVDWARRPIREDGPWTHERGRAWEDLLDLARALDSDLWLNVPPAADDAYCTALAAMVARELPPGRRLYVELGRDLWDEGLPSHRWFAALARPGDDPIALAKRRMREVFAIFRTALGDERVVRVVSGVAADSYFATTWLSDLDVDVVDALALNCALTAFLPAGADPQGWGLPDVMASCEANRRRMTRPLQAHLGLARSHGLRLLAYQIGVGTWPADYSGLSPATIERIHRLARDPGLRPLVDAWQADWDAAVGDAACSWHAARVP